MPLHAMWSGRPQRSTACPTTRLSLGDLLHVPRPGCLSEIYCMSHDQAVSRRSTAYPTTRLSLGDLLHVPRSGCLSIYCMSHDQAVFRRSTARPTIRLSFGDLLHVPRSGCLSEIYCTSHDQPVPRKSTAWHVISYDRGWRVDVVNQRLVFAGYHILAADERSLCIRCICSFCNILFK